MNIIYMNQFKQIYKIRPTEEGQKIAYKTVAVFQIMVLFNLEKRSDST